MVKKKNNNKTNPKKKIKTLNNCLNLVSPFNFNENDNFIYNIKFYKDFYRFGNSFNKYKPFFEDFLIILFFILIICVYSFFISAYLFFI